MPDYKEMYLTLFRATEDAINRLIAAHQLCEEMYLSEPEPEVKVIFGSKNETNSGDSR